MVSAESPPTSKNMKVIEHQSSNFFLIEADGSYFLDVLCSRSFVSYSITIQLDDAERAKFKTLGVPYIETLAETISRKQNIYLKRQVDSATGAKLHAAVMAWNADTG